MLSLTLAKRNILIIEIERNIILNLIKKKETSKLNKKNHPHSKHIPPL